MLPGDLVLFGRGDPTLMRPWTGGPYQPDPLEALARQLQDQGVRASRATWWATTASSPSRPTAPAGNGRTSVRVRGRATALAIHHNVVDLWVYPAPAAGAPCWIFAQPGHGLFDFINATMTRPSPAKPGIRANRLPGEATIRVTGSLAPGADPVRLTVPVRDSALWAARLLERALARHGIQVLGKAGPGTTRTGRPPGAGPAGGTGHLESPPHPGDPAGPGQELRQPVMPRWCCSRRGPGVPAGPHHPEGLLAMAAWMARAGLAPGDAVLEEGSGLSRKNLLKPDGIIQLLAYMDRQPEAAAFRSLLPVAGVDGTLRLRLEGTAAQGNLAAKTGTLRNTNALSGYVTGAGGERLAFAILRNNYHYDTGSGRRRPRRTWTPSRNCWPGSPPAPRRRNDGFPGI